MSEIKFSNLIFEEAKEVLAQTTNPTFEHYQNKINTPGTNLNKLTGYSNVDPKLDYSQQLSINEQVQGKKLNHYISKVNSPGTNLIALELSIDSEPMLSDTEKKNLYRMIADKRKDPSKTLDYKLYSTYFPRPNTSDPNAPLEYYSGFASTSLGNVGIGGTAGFGSTAEQTLELDSGSGAELDPETLSKLNLESLYSGGIEQDPSIKTRGMKPSDESIRMQQTQELASLEGQLKETLKKINLLDKVYAELVRNPTNLNLGSIINAHSGSKFVKLAEKDIKEADERLEDYYNNEMDYAPYGTALEHPQETKNIPTKDIKVHSQSVKENPKFRKIN
jgi:hypothetical protein